MTRRRKQAGSLYQRKGFENWYGKYRTAAGKIRRVSLKTDSKIEARVRLDVQVNPKLREPDPVPMVTKLKAESFQACARDWLEWYIEARRPSEKRAVAARRFVEGRWKDAFGHRLIANITDVDVARYFNSRLDQDGAAWATMNDEKKLLAQIFARAIRAGHCKVNLAREYELPEAEEENNRTALTLAEFDSVLVHVAKQVDRDALSLYFWTGARKSELAAATYSDISLNGDGKEKLKLIATKTKKKQTLKDRTRCVPLLPDTVDIIERLREHGDGEHVLPSFKGNHLYHIVRCAAKRAGFDMRERSIGLHTMRHSFCSFWANKPGIPLPWTQSWAGHADLSTTSAYVHADDSAQHETMLRAMSG